MTDRITPLGWALLFLIGAVLNLCQPGWAGVLAGHLQDPDSYMRLERILQGIAQGHLVNRVARDDSGAGVLVEWSRLLDALLWLMAAPLAVFIGWRQALFAAGVALGPLGMGGLGLALAFAARPVAEKRYLWTAPVAAALLPGLRTFAVPGVVHYHILLLALIALAVGLVVRGWRGSTGWAWLAGLAGGAAIWLTPETMPFILLAYTGLLLRWLALPIGDALAACAGGFAAMLTFALAVDPPAGGFLVAEIDRLSLVYAVLGWLLLAGALAVRWMQRWPPMRRRVGGLVLMAALLLGWIAMFPKVALGPYGLMDAADRQAFFGGITELQPAASWASLNGFLLPGLVALLYLAWRTAQDRRGAWVWAYAAFCSGVALLLGVKFILFVEFSAGAAAGLLPVMLSDAGARLKTPLLAGFVRLGLLFIVLLLPQLQLPARAKAAAWPPAPGCDLLHINRMLAPAAGAVVLADVGDTPELLYRTGIVTVGSLYQHGVPGFMRARAAWRSLPGQREPAALAASRARFVLFCPRQGRTDLVADLPQVTLWDTLGAGNPPPWLRLQAQDARSGWELFGVR